MKRLLIFAMLAVIALQACNKSDDLKPDQISEKAKQALQTKYPDADNVVWRSKNGYVIAKFTQNVVRSVSAQQLDAWFDNQGQWYMTETEILFNQLPEEVQTAFNASLYAAWRIDDVDKIERNDTETVYVIEVEQTDKDMDLYYSPDGILIKEVTDVDDDYDYEDYILSDQNSEIESYINTNYPGSRIFEIDREGRYIEVEILDGRTKRELMFENTTWVRTKTELRESDLPKTVADAFSQSEYSSYRIDDIDHLLTSDSEYFRIEIKTPSGDVKINITTAGVITVAEVDADNDDYVAISGACKEFISTKYPSAKILEAEYEKGYLKVEVYHDSRVKKIRLNSSDVWIDTRWDVNNNSLPQAVKNSIALSYPSYEIDDAEYVESSTAGYYLIELEKGDNKVTMRIKPDGTVL